MANGKQLQTPGSSWETVKKIIRAYHAAQEDESPTIEHIAGLAGVQRPVVSMNNNFLRASGILQEDQNKLTPLGVRLATGISHGNQSLIMTALQDVAKGYEPLSRLINLLRARGEMKTEAFRGEIILLGGLSQDARAGSLIKTILDLLQESRLVEINEDAVRFKGFYVGEITGVSDERPSVKTSTDSTAKQADSMRSSSAIEADDLTIPIPLGVGRLVRIKLPEDWSAAKDLPKLLKMLQLSLGDGEDEK